MRRFFAWTAVALLLCTPIGAQAQNARATLEGAAKAVCQTGVVPGTRGHSRQGGTRRIDLALAAVPSSRYSLSPVSAIRRQRRSFEPCPKERLVVVPKKVVHPGLPGGWWLSMPPAPEEDPDEASR